MSGAKLKFAEEQPQPVQLTEIGAAFQKAEAVTPASNPPLAKRYDEATVQKVLTLAMELQTEHRSTLTAEQIVAIGEEASIEPEFVRRALAEIDAESTEASRSRIVSMYPTSGTSVSRISTRFRALPRNAILAAVAIPAVYTFLTLLQFNSATFGIDAGSKSLVNQNVCILAPALAFIAGFLLRSKRLGSITGLFLGIGLMFDAVIVCSASHTVGSSAGEYAWQTLAFSSAGAVLGTLGAVVSSDVPRISRRIVSKLARRSRDADNAAPPTQNPW